MIALTTRMPQINTGKALMRQDTARTVFYGDTLTDFSLIQVFNGIGIGPWHIPSLAEHGTSYTSLPQNHSMVNICLFAISSTWSREHNPR